MRRWPECGRGFIFTSTETMAKLPQAHIDVLALKDQRVEIIPMIYEEGRSLAEIRLGAEVHSLQ